LDGVVDIVVLYLDYYRIFSSSFSSFSFLSSMMRLLFFYIITVFYSDGIIDTLYIKPWMCAISFRNTIVPPFLLIVRLFAVHFFKRLGSSQFCV
jgi:hypothetical protein